MAKDWAKPFYRSAAWRKCRAAYAASVHHLCERCGEPGTEVHHKQELTPDNIHDPAVALAWGNLELLCHRCHDQTKRAERRPTQDGLTFGPDGQLVAAPPLLGSRGRDIGDRVPSSVYLPRGLSKAPTPKTTKKAKKGGGDNGNKKDGATGPATRPTLF